MADTDGEHGIWLVVPPDRLDVASWQRRSHSGACACTLSGPHEVVPRLLGRRQEQSDDHAASARTGQVAFAFAPGKILATT